jgi:hypothetical protein
MLNGTCSQNRIKVVVAHANKNKNRSNKTVKKKSVNCDKKLFGSGSTVIRRVIAVNVKPQKRERTPERFER